MPPGRGMPRAGFPVCCPFAPLCRAGLRPQARFGAQPPKAALGAEILTPPPTLRRRLLPVFLLFPPCNTNQTAYAPQKNNKAALVIQGGLAACMGYLP